MLTIPKDRVAIIAIKDPEKIGSIIVPDAAKKRTDQGIVKYVGSDVTLVKPGDYVIFHGWTGTAIEIGGEGHVMIFLPESEIEAVLHPPATEIPGLYHATKDGEVFPATYESVMEIVRKTYWELPRFANLINRDK